MTPRTALALTGALAVAASVALSGRQAPKAASDESLAALRDLRTAALRDDYALERLAYLSDVIGPRLSGSPQGAAAVTYVAGELRNLGLEVRLEEVKVPHWVRGEERAELIAYPGQVPQTTQHLAVTALGTSPATPPGGLSAELVVVPDFEAFERLDPSRVTGRIVVFNKAFDERLAQAGYAEQAYGEAVDYRHRGPSAASRRGAVACLVRSAGSGGHRLPHTGGTTFEAGVRPIPAGALSAEDAALVERLARRGPVKMRLVLTPQTLPDVGSHNVIADIRGREHPDEVVIVSGHLDSWDLGTGAIDDGGGVAVAMAVGHLVRQLGLHPARTIRIVAWAAEEPGLLGSRAYSKQHAGDLAKHVGAIEVDLGVAHPVGFEIGGAPSIAATLQPVAALLGENGAGLVRTVELAGSDVIALGILGVPTFAPVQDTRRYFDYHHTAADTLDKVEPGELRENVAVVAVLAYALAELPGPLPHTPRPIPDWMK